MSTPNRQLTNGTLRAMAHRPTDGQPMLEVRRANVMLGRGFDTENRKPGLRELTLLSVEAWAQACAELGVVLPWYTRRANLLIEGVDLACAIGRTLVIGPVRVAIHGETKPCRIMDEQHQGLRTALEPFCRGGVHGQVLNEGTLRIGDSVRVE